MTDEELASIAAELEAVNAVSEFGPSAVEIAAAIAAGVPIVGPVLGVFIKRVGDQAVSPNLREIMARIVWEIQLLVPEVSKVKTLEDRVRLLEQRRDDPKVASLLSEAVKIIGQEFPEIKFETDDGELSAKNMTAHDRSLSSIASNGGQVDLSCLVQSGGSATFRTESGGRQVLDGSNFLRSTQSVGGTYMGPNVVHQGGETVFNGPEATVQHKGGDVGFHIILGSDDPKVIIGGDGKI